jgi:glycosyltransferase involved in cell wall biosynthesis
MSELQPHNLSTHSLPTVTVIMPVRNEGGFIRQSLDAVLEQDYPSEQITIVVADGMSDDDTRAIVREFQSRCPNILLVDNPGRIAPTGLNAALRHAQGDIIVRVDGHCIIQPDYIRRCVEELNRPADGEGGEIVGVGGPMETIGETPTAQAIALAMSSPFGVGGSAFRTVRDREMWVDTVAFPAYRRSVMQQAGPFDEELVRNQDDEYNFRLRSMGGRILMTPSIRSRYYSRSAFRSLWKQYFQYGFWKVRVMQKHPRQMSARQFAPPLFVASLAFTILMAPIWKPARTLLRLVVGAYAAANIAASITTARKAGWRQIPPLSLAYTILHLAYGSGFLVGLVKFIRRWSNRGLHD